MSKLPPRRTGLILGTARTGLGRGYGRPLTEAERFIRHRNIFGQGYNKPIRTKILQTFPALKQFPMVVKFLKGL